MLATPMIRFILASLLLVPGMLLQRAPTLDQVIERATAHIATYESRISMLIADERYDLKKTYRGSAESETRRLYSDILLVRDGADSYPVRAVRRTDDYGADPTDFERKEPVAAMGSRPDIMGIRRTLNLPTIPLSVLRRHHVERFTFHKEGEERIDGSTAWRIRVEGPFESSSNLKLWILPNSGQVVRTQVKVNAIVNGGPYRTRMLVQYEMNDRFSLMTPVKLEEVDEDSILTMEGTADYTYVRRTGPQSSGTVSAPDEIPEPDSGEYRLVVDVPLVTLDVSVTGERGAVTNLAADDFVVYENDELQTISNFNSASVPFNVLMLFDWSSSALEKRAFMQDAAGEFIQRLRPQDWVGIGRFAGDVQMEGWTAVRGQASRRISDTLGYHSNVLGPGYRRITVATTNGSLNVLQSRAGYDVQ